MSRPNLYQIPNQNNLFSVHEFARKNDIAVRKARRILEKMIKENKIVLLRDTKKRTA